MILSLQAAQKQVTGQTCFSGHGLPTPGLDTIAANVLWTYCINLQFYFYFSNLGGGGTCFWKKKKLKSYKKAHRLKWVLIPTSDGGGFLRVR